MAEPRAHLTWMEFSSDVLELMVDRGLEVAFQILAAIDIPDRTLTEFDRLNAISVEQHRDIRHIILDEDIEIETSMVALLLLASIYHWNKWGAKYFDDTEVILRLVWQDDESPAKSDDAKLVDAVLEALLGLSWIVVKEDLQPAALESTIEGFTRAAQVFDESNDRSSALACAQTAADFAEVSGPERAEAASSLAVSISRRNANESVAAVEVVRHALAVARVASTDPNRKLDAFDAVENALLLLMVNESVRETGLEMLAPRIEQEDYLAPLRIVLMELLRLSKRQQSLQFPGYETSMMLEHLEKYSTAMYPLWEGSTEDWLGNKDYVKVWSVNTENSRLLLHPSSPKENPRLIWANWTIQHPNLRRAVPQRLSLLRESNLNEILLVLNHEITHVYSLWGTIGIADLAMRWALLELEIIIWGQTGGNTAENALAAFLDAAKPASLPQSDDEIKAPLLARVEQEIEVERKLQIFENIWAPWLEGIAVFGELSADPRDDPLVSTPNTLVVTNLRDIDVGQVSAELGITLNDAIYQQYLAGEKLYGDALQQSRLRLRTYLVDYPSKYLPGYLAARSIVAKWRWTIGRPITGAEAFRILLHVTRFSHDDNFPDLGLPLEEFHDRAVEHQVAWMNQLSEISAEDLENFLQRYDRSRHWVNGRLVPYDENDPEDFLHRFVDFARQALFSLTGVHAPIERVPNANDDCVVFMEHIAELLEERTEEPLLFTSEMFERIISPFLILPLGEVDCPFWLLAQDNLLACFIRTQEQDLETDAPRYDFIRFNLDASEVAELRDNMARGHGRRMKVTRVADLAGLQGGTLGVNYLAFQYGSWTYIQRRGLGLNASAEIEPSVKEVIRDRLVPNSLFQMQERLAGDDHLAAQRTLQWVDETDWKIRLLLSERDTDEETGLGADEGGSLYLSEFDLTPWAQKVTSETRTLLRDQDATGVNSHSLRMLRFSLGIADSDAETLAQQGMGMIGRQFVSEIINVLDASGIRPVVDTAVSPRLLRRLESSIQFMERTPHGWDVIRPAGHREEGTR